jgi:hypothetical protein
MNDQELERRVRGYFVVRAHEHEVPDFDSMLADAASRGRRRRISPWLVPMLAASVVVAVALLRTDHDGPNEQATAALIAELSTSTHWTAPSDRWLGRQMPMQFRALPDFDLMTTPPEDTKAWL